MMDQLDLCDDLNTRVGSAFSRVTLLDSEPQSIRETCRDNILAAFCNVTLEKKKLKNIFVCKNPLQTSQFPESIELNLIFDIVDTKLHCLI